MSFVVDKAIDRMYKKIIENFYRMRRTILHKSNWLTSRDVCRAVWWKIMPGETIAVSWPVATTENPTDPNEQYRPELEKLVGRQGIDWDWNISKLDIDKLIIKFRIGKRNYASYFKLKWH